MESILFTVKNGIATITLNRQEKLNAFNREMAISLQHYLDECNRQQSIRCVIITGAGKSFSAGQDLSEVVDKDGPGMEKILVEHYNPIVTKIRQLEKPVIAAVNGVAAGAGANIALCCDIVVASANASFIQAFSRIGLIPDSGGTFFLPRLVGWQKASALFFLGDKIIAEDADKMGMIYKVFSAVDFERKTWQLAETLSAMPTRSFALTKKALNYSFTNNFEAQLELEDRLQQQAASTADYHEGVSAFLAKRTPVFQGE
jgi:2-(1,2-epoxy-1,2-dihydrophenyl)acetyl-CoA isomerase